jgi:hypothetical protein
MLSLILTPPHCGVVLKNFDDHDRIAHKALQSKMQFHLAHIVISANVSFELKSSHLVKDQLHAWSRPSCIRLHVYTHILYLPLYPHVFDLSLRMDARLISEFTFHTPYRCYDLTGSIFFEPIEAHAYLAINTNCKPCLQPLAIHLSSTTQSKTVLNSFPYYFSYILGQVDKAFQ